MIGEVPKQEPVVDGVYLADVIVKLEAARLNLAVLTRTAECALAQLPENELEIADEMLALALAAKVADKCLKTVRLKASSRVAILLPEPVIKKGRISYHV